MQILKVKKPGTKTALTVKVLRSWANSRGGTIYLHHNGVYGYKDGSPVLSEQELADNIHAPVQKKLALRWWKSVGRRLSEDFYAAREQMEISSSSDFQQLDDGANSALDMALYRRRGVKPGAAVSGPKSWMELGFPSRPDWWGQARLIEVGIWIYELLDEREDDPVADSAIQATPSLAEVAQGAGSGAEAGA
ncbi:MAG: hypothetical protein ACOY4W_16755 [Thermodesulfobacteriota bacterium]